MSDLISRNAILDNIDEWSKKMSCENSVQGALAEFTYMIANAPTDFDLDNVIFEIEKRIKEYGNIKAYDVFQSMYFRGISKGYFESLEILKSAANATNGKNGG